MAPSRRTKESKSVWFDVIEIIEFPIELGDNPSVKEGAPITLGWKSNESNSYEIDYYESTRDECRERDKLTLSAKRRTEM
jgi:hypothetical protein